MIKNFEQLINESVELINESTETRKYLHKKAILKRYHDKKLVDRINRLGNSGFHDSIDTGNNTNHPVVKDLRNRFDNKKKVDITNYLHALDSYERHERRHNKKQSNSSDILVEAICVINGRSS